MEQDKNCPCCNYPNCGHDHSKSQEGFSKAAVKDGWEQYKNHVPPKDNLQLFGVTPEMAADFMVWTVITFVIATMVNLTLLSKYRWSWLNVVILSLVAGYGYYKGRNKGERNS
jgi:hypothetical protein